MNFLILGIILVVIGIGGLFIMKRNEDLGVTIGMIGLIGGLIIGLPSLIEYTQSDDEYNMWIKNRKRVEVYLMTLNKIEDTQQLLIIYEDVKDSNDKLIESIDGINDNDWFTDFYDKRFLNHKPLILPNKSGDSYIINEQTREEESTE